MLGGLLVQVLPGAGVHCPQFAAQGKPDELVQAETVGRFVGDRDQLFGDAVAFERLNDGSDIGIPAVTFRQQFGE